MTRRTSLLTSAVLSLMLLGLAGPALASSGSENAKDDHAEEYHFNWYHGFIGVREGEPNLLFRAPGTPPPLGAMLVNTGILFYILFRFGRAPLQDALKKRKAAIMQGMDDAARMKEEAQARLTDLEDKLDHIDDEVERVRREMQTAGKVERDRILAEAKERRERMERDAQLLVRQELKVAHDTLLAETVASAVESARATIEKAMTPSEHRRLAEEYIAGLDGSLGSAHGGRS